MVKICFLGDIMCEGPFLRAAKKNGEYDFEKCFEGLRNYLNKADFVVGNIETPLTDSSDRLTISSELYSFNTPKEFIIAVKNAGIDLALTANNHCLDRGISGLLRTLVVLDDCNLYHTGTYNDERNSVFYHRIQDVSFAVISCTASTNSELTDEKPSINNINLINEFDTKKSKKTIKQLVINNVIGLRRYMALRRLLHKSPLNPTMDNAFNKEKADRLLDRLERQINEASEKCDYVFVCPHMGGQFNVTPGAYSEYVMHRLTSTKAAAVIASHPHILQKAVLHSKKPCFYSLGNVTMSLNTEYLIKDNRPDLGAIVNVIIDKGKPPKYTFTLIREIEDRDGYIRVSLLYDLINNSSGVIKKQYIQDYFTAIHMLKPEWNHSDILLEIPFEGEL